MDANQFFFWLRGYVELSSEVPSAATWAAIRAEVLRTQPVKPEFIEMHNPTHLPAGLQLPTTRPGGCGCEDCKNKKSDVHS